MNEQTLTEAIDQMVGEYAELERRSTNANERALAKILGSIGKVLGVLSRRLDALEAAPGQREWTEAELVDLYELGDDNIFDFARRLGAKIIKDEVP